MPGARVPSILPPNPQHGQLVRNPLGGISVWDANVGDLVSPSAVSNVSNLGQMDPLAFTGFVPVGAESSGAAAAGVNPFFMLATFAFVMYGILGQPNAKDRRSKGYAFRFRENPADPNEPIIIVYGKPVWVPQVLFRYLTSENLDSLTPAKGQKFVICLGLGFGPLDGSDLKLWENDRVVLEKVTTESPTAERSLTAVDATNRVFAFPKKNVVPSTVVIYEDGTAIAVGGENGEVVEIAYTSYTNEVVKDRRVIDVDKAGASAEDFIDDPEAPDKTADARIGGYFPENGIVDEQSVSLKMVTLAKSTIWWSGNGSSKVTTGPARVHTVPADNIHVSKNRDDRPYFWVSAAKGAPPTTSGNVAFFKVDAKIRPEVVIEIREGTWVAVFDAAHTGTMTATFDVSTFGEEIKFQFRNGARNQDPLPTDGIRNAKVVGTELTAFSAQTYTTTREVDDVEIVLESGPEGFYDHAISGRDMCDFRQASRDIQIRIRKNGAGDAKAKNNDPATGWVTLSNPNEDKDRTDHMRIHGQVNGPARWFFSAANLLHFTRGRPYGVAAATLPRAKYDIEVMALDAPNVDSQGVELGAERIRSEVFFAHVNEINRTRLTVPHLATLTVEVGDLEQLPAEPVYAVQMWGRKVWVPDSNATYSATTGRPEPGEWLATRNPAWNACDLITNEYFGGGEYFTWAHVDLTLALAASSFASSWADLDIVFRHFSALWDHVAQCFAGARIFPALSGGTWRFVIDQDGSTVMDITEDEIEEGQVTVHHPSLEEIPTEVEASFTDEEMDFELDVERRRLPGRILQRVVRRTDLTGVRRRDQVGTVLDLLLEQFRLQRTTIDIVGDGLSYDLLLLEAGDLVRLTSTVADATLKTFRVASIGWGINYKPAIRLMEHAANAYANFAGPSGTITPGLRPPSGESSTKTASAASTTGATVTGAASADMELKKWSVLRIAGKGSVRFRGDVGDLPDGVRAVVVRWRRTTGDGRSIAPWAKVGTFGESTFEFGIPDVGLVEFDAYARDTRGRRGKSRQTTTSTRTKIEVLEPVAALTAENTPEAKVEIKGPKVVATQDVPDGFETSDYQVEAVQVPKDGNTQDGLHLGFFEPREEIPMHAWPAEGDNGEQEVHTRLIRLDDEDKSPWREKAFTVPELDEPHAEGHSNDFASGTIVDFLGTVEPLEISSGDLRFVARTINDLAGLQINDLAGLQIRQLGSYWTPGKYRTDVVELDQNEDIQIQIAPEFTSITRASLTIDDYKYRTIRRQETVGSTFTDRRRERYNHQIAGDRIPVRLDFKVATSTTASPTFVDADYEDYEPGQVLQNVKAYSVEVGMHTQYGTQMTLDKLIVRHWVYCRFRPWCQFARTHQLIDDVELSGAATHIDVTVTGQEWDELAMEIEWTNANASATRMALRFNGSAAEEVTITPAGEALAAVDWYERTALLIRPKTGDRRYIRVQEQAQWKTTSTNDVAAPFTLVWDDTATAITSIRVTTDQPASAYMGSGSRVRIYGRREYKE